MEAGTNTISKEQFVDFITTLEVAEDYAYKLSEEGLDLSGMADKYMAVIFQAMDIMLNGDETDIGIVFEWLYDNNGTSERKVDLFEDGKVVGTIKSAEELYDHLKISKI